MSRHILYSGCTCKFAYYRRLDYWPWRSVLSDYPYSYIRLSICLPNYTHFSLDNMYFSMQLSRYLFFILIKHLLCRRLKGFSNFTLWLRGVAFLKCIFPVQSSDDSQPCSRWMACCCQTDKLSFFLHLFKILKLLVC